MLFAKKILSFKEHVPCSVEHTLGPIKHTICSTEHSSDTSSIEMAFYTASKYRRPKGIKN